MGSRRGIARQNIILAFGSFSGHDKTDDHGTFSSPSLRITHGNNVINTTHLNLPFRLFLDLTHSEFQPEPMFAYSDP